MIKIRKNLGLTAIFIALLFIGCENEEKIISSSYKINENKIINNQKEEKIKSALSFLNKYFTKAIRNQNRSNKRLDEYFQNIIDTIYTLNDHENKPLLKLICFKPQGYVLISNIENVPNPPILFYSTQKFDKDNASPALIDYVEEFTATHTKDGNAPSPDDDMPGYYNPVPVPIGTPWDETEEKGPLLSTYWRQGLPYNKYCLKIDGEYAKVGCVAVAIGQIMNYHRKNTIKRYNWEKINVKNVYRYYDVGTISDEVAKFLHDIGVGVNMDYGVGSSGAYAEDAVAYFKKAGYNHAHLIDYNYELFKNYIAHNKPLYIRARRIIENPFGWKTSSIGHAWVADGYRVFKKMSDAFTDTGYVVTHMKTTLSSTSYIHMNWGWGEQNNDNEGWCTYDYFRTENEEYQHDKKIIIY